MLMKKLQIVLKVPLSNMDCRGFLFFQQLWSKPVRLMA